MSFIAAFAVIRAVPVLAAVNMISVEHRVWGDAGVSPTKNTYDEVSLVPLSRNASGQSYNPFGSSWNYASSSASDWSVNAYRYGDMNYANGYAQNTYVFKPFSRELSISLNGVIGAWWFESKAKMTLIDRSTNSLVSSYYSPSYSGISPFPSYWDPRSYPFNWGTNLEVNPEHEYELVIYASAHRGEGGDGSASIALTLVPEPGTTLLTCLAVLLMCGRRQRPVLPSTEWVSTIEHEP